MVKMKSDSFDTGGIGASTNRLTWKQLEEVVSPNFVDHVRAGIRDQLPLSEQDAAKAAVRNCFGWTFREDRLSQPRVALLRLVLAGSAPHVSPPESSDLLREQLTLWADWLRHEGYAGSTIGSYTGFVARVLGHLSDRDGRAYPPFDRIRIPCANTGVKTASLGANEWPEIATADGWVAREKRALALVAGHAVEQFHEMVDAHDWGTAVLAGRVPDGGDPARCEPVGRLLENARRLLGEGDDLLRQLPLLRTTGRSVTKIMDKSTWEGAGFPRSYLERLDRAGTFNSPSGVLSFVIMPSLGPTLSSSVLFAKAFAAATGWNLQPILDLPLHPVAFRSRSALGVSRDPAYLSAFKKRARTFAVARIKEGPILPDDDARAIWDIAADDTGDPSEADRRAILPFGTGGGGRGVASALQAQERMAAAISGYPAGSRTEGFLLTYLTFSGLRRNPRDIWCCRPLSAGLLARPGCGFRSIRKSHKIMRDGNAGSISAMGATSGTSTSRIEMRAYQDAPELEAARQTSIRLTQEVVQAHVKHRPGVVVEAPLPAEELRMYRALGRMTGLSSALEPDEAAPPTLPPPLSFKPEPGRLMSLYLVRRELKLCRLRIGPERWSVQALPMLERTRSICRGLFDQGYGPAYLAQARNGERLLKSGGIELPVILE